MKAPGARPEIWACGFREPRRFSFDRATGELWVGYDDGIIHRIDAVLLEFVRPGK